MKFAKIAFALSCLMALSACKDFSGSTTVNQRISLVDGRKTISIAPGTYSGDLKVNSKKKFVLVMKLPSGKAKFDFTTDKNLKKLSSGDKIQISSRVSGQPYAVNGIYDTDSSESETRYGTESCTYTTREYECRKVDVPKDCQRNCDSRQCGHFDVSHTGTQDVEYTWNSTTESVSLNLLDANNKIVAAFRGSSSDGYKSYSYQGRCR